MVNPVASVLERERPVEGKHQNEEKQRHDNHVHKFNR